MALMNPVDIRNHIAKTLADTSKEVLRKIDFIMFRLRICINVNSDWNKCYKKKKEEKKH